MQQSRYGGFKWNTSINAKSTTQQQNISQSLQFAPEIVQSLFKSLLTRQASFSTEAIHHIQ